MTQIREWGKKSLAIILALCAIVSLSTVYAQAKNVFDTYQAEKKQAEETALTYTRAFIENTFLYTDHDLSKGTVKELKELPSQLDIDNTYQELCDNISFIEEYADYLRHIRSTQRFQRFQFRVVPTILSTVIGDRQATVHLYVEVMFQYEKDGETSEFGDEYTVTLLKSNNCWYLSNFETEEMLTFGINKNTFDAKIETECFDKDYTSGIFNSPQNMIVNEDTATEAVGNGAKTLTISQQYNKTNAIAYAYTYTTSTYTGGSNNPSFLNPLFPDYSGGGGNCQNFASQCVWAGFGGSNDQASIIDEEKFPMDEYGTGIWTKSNTNGTWAHTTTFYGYVNSESSGVRMRGNKYDIQAGNNFSSIPNATSVLPGSILYVIGWVNDHYEPYNHAVVITSATGTGYANIQFCSNSPMRKAAVLSDSAYYLYRAYPMRVLVPTTMVRSDSCLHQYASSSTGTPCVCQLCGFNRLFPVPVLKKPLAVGTTSLLKGTTNVQCYRLAIGVTQPNGVTTWKEFSSTNIALWSYTFSQTGLYTIQFAARDISPLEPGSTNVTKVFTIRVY